jgi:pyruvate/2-oxoglutarate dehydrogenase complex dihydrolipoamide acyltransferase (E2) component
MDSKSYCTYQDVNFGWSFDSGSNLKVLAIKNSDRLSLQEIHLEVLRLLEMYESNQAIPTELMIESTVTLSDLSKTDVAFMLPLINGYQSMIMGVVSKAERYFSIYVTFDHRISEGLGVSKFLSELKYRILSYYLDDNKVANVSCHVCEKTMFEELSLGHRGLLKITLPSGDDANICRNCLDGW